MNGPYVRRMILEPSYPDREVPVNETFHEQIDDELTEKELKQVEADDQAIQTILLGLPVEIYDAVNSCETAQEIWLRVQQMIKDSDFVAWQGHLNPVYQQWYPSTLPSKADQLVKDSDFGIQEKKAKLFNEWERFTSTDGESIESYYHRFSKLMNDFKRNKHFPEKIASNLKFLNNLQPEWSRHVTIVHQTKDLHTADYTQLYDFLKYNQKEVDDLRAERLARTHDPLALMANSNNPFNYPVFHQDQPSPSTFMQQPLPNNNYNPQPSFNQNYMQQPMLNVEDISDPTTTMNMTLTDTDYGGNGGNQFRQYARQNVGNQNGYNTLQNVRNQIPNGNGNVVAARAEGNANGNNGNQIRCYNCRGLGHFARNCTVRPRRRDVAYLQTQLLIAQKEEAGIQLQAEEFDLMAAAGDLDEIEEVNANCILMANLQQASTSGTQTDKAPVYDSDGSAENDSNVISEVSSMEQGVGIVEQHPATVEETRAYFESLYNNLAIKVEKVNTVNRKLRETNADLTTELARYKNQEKCFEISQEKYDKLERCYQKSVYQEQCLTKKINALHLSSGKQITTLNEEISNLNNQLSKEKSTVSSLQEEKKKLKSDFKIREDELLDKQIQLENKIKELDNILVKMGQSIQTMHMLSPKPDSFYHTEQKMALGYQNPFYLKQAQQKQQSLYNGKVLLEKHDPPAVYDSEETLQLAQESREKMKQLNKEIKPANYTKINHLLGVFVSQTAKSREELYFSNTSKTANVSKSISIPNEEFSDDTTPSVARKFLNEIHKIVKDEIFPIVNQVDARVQNFEIQFLKEAAKFVRDFKSLAKEADESLAKHKALEFEIERLLRAVVSQDIMSIVQNPTVVETSDLQTELERTKERFENCIIKKENEYAKLWNDWYKKCEECKYDKISYDKAYNDMQQKIERLQAQLGDLKGKSKDTPCVSNTLDPLSQKLENENVELEFQIKNYAKENAHLKTAYKNLFDSINVSQAQSKGITDSLQNKLNDPIYENIKLRAQLSDKVSKQKDTTKGTSLNTQFCKQSILGKPPSSSGSKLYYVTPFPKPKGLPKIDESHALIHPFKTSREDKFVPINKVRASVRTNSLTVPQPHVISKKDVNFDSNGLSSTGVDITTKTRRP
ncbi:retrovirus-related pol polyprotein from transposon TNT 1-94 [Tanacetum coccineum]